MLSGLVVGGLGYQLNDICKLLDAEKVRIAACKLYPRLRNCMRSQVKRYSEYRCADNAGKLRILEELMDGDIRGIAGFLLKSDTDNLLLVGTDHLGSTVIYYPPRFPWKMKEQERTSEEDAIRYLGSLVQPYVLPDIAPTDLDGCIRYFHV